MHKILCKSKRDILYVRKLSSSLLNFQCASASKVKNVTKVTNERSLNFNQIPGPKRYPLIGTLYKYLPFGEYKAETLDKNAWLNWRRYGYLVRESLPGLELLHVYHPDDIETVFRNEGGHPMRRSHLAMLHYRQSKPAVYSSGGLLATNGADWWRIRSTFQKNFTSPQSMKDHVSTTDEVVKEFVQWVKQCPSIDDALPYLSRLNLEITGAVAFNERFNSFSQKEQEPNSRSSRAIAAAFGSNSGIFQLDQGFLWKYFNTPLYRKLAESQDCLEKIAKDILLMKVHYFETDNNEIEKSLLGTFVQQPNISLKDILGIMVDILMAAVDTTAFSTSFALYHLGRNQECQNKFFEEVSRLLPDKNSNITPDTLSQAQYVKACVKESLRLNPVSIGVGRVLQKDLVLSGYLVPKGTVIVTQNMVASRLPQFVKDPLTYKPERWLRDSDRYEKLHPFLSLPFGFGPRSCIARRLAEQNITIALMRMVREFRLDWKSEKLGIRTYLINKPDKPVRISFSSRV